MAGDNENDDNTSFFVTPKRASSERMAARPSEPSKPAESRSSGRRVEDAVVQPQERPISEPAATPRHRVDRVVDDRGRTRSYRTIAILGFFFMLSVCSLMVAGYSVYGRYLSDSREESDWGDRGQASFELEEETGLQSSSARKGRKGRRGAGKSGGKTAGSVVTRNLTISIDGDHPYNYVLVKCSKSGFRSARLALNGASVQVSNVPTEVCTVDFDGGAGAHQQFQGIDLTFRCEFKRDRMKCR
jgi:hypothetical protein